MQLTQNKEHDTAVISAYVILYNSHKHHIKDATLHIA